MSILFLPGTAVHEFSHYAIALLLQVPVGKMELLPKLDGNNLKLGSVQVAKSDPIRRFLIGSAPFIFGIALILGTFFYAQKVDLLSNNIYTILLGYFVFEVGNTMFSSKKDMEGALELILVVLFIVVLMYFVGIRIPSVNPGILLTNKKLIKVFQQADLFIAAPIAIDFFIIGFLKLLRRK